MAPEGSHPSPDVTVGKIGPYGPVTVRYWARARCRGCPSSAVRVKVGGRNRITDTLPPAQSTRQVGTKLGELRIPSSPADFQGQ